MTQFLSTSGLRSGLGPLLRMPKEVTFLAAHHIAKQTRVITTVATHGRQKKMTIAILRTCRGMMVQSQRWERKCQMDRNRLAVKSSGCTVSLRKGRARHGGKASLDV